jgi:dethiobiotin synthetase
MAPPMAAAALGVTLPGIAELAAALAASWPAPGCDLAVVEGAGGVASPLGADGTTADLAAALRPDRVVVVADPELGVIHSARLCVGALAPLPAVVHLNRFDGGSELHRRNAAWLAEVDGMTVTTAVDDLLDELTR